MSSFPLFPPSQEDDVLSVMIPRAAISSPSGLDRSSIPSQVGMWGDARPASADLLDGSDVFTTPGETSTTTPSGESKYQVVVLDASDPVVKALCLGIKRGGATFCVNAKCTKNRDHGQNRLPKDIGPFGGVYIANNPMSAFIGPYLSLQRINKSEAHALEGKYLSTDQCVEQFMVFHRIYDTRVSQDEEITFERAKGEIIKAKETKTPFMTKRKGGPMTLFAIESFSPHKNADG
ncbi:hypothetical protein ACA910_009040 [Epithemia clementina (nom. ined.)]